VALRRQRQPIPALHVVQVYFNMHDQRPKLERNRDPPPFHTHLLWHFFPRPPFLLRDLNCAPLQIAAAKVSVQAHSVFGTRSFLRRSAALEA
jgi:hypothetical protein